MVRRSGDPKDSDRGPINSIEPVLSVPSHHGPDVQTVIEGINIQTMAVKSTTTIMHVHCIIAELDNEPDVNEILSMWESTPRVNLLEGFLHKDGSKIRNLPGRSRDNGICSRCVIYSRRPESDCSLERWSSCIWKEIILLSGYTPRVRCYSREYRCYKSDV